MPEAPLETAPSAPASGRGRTGAGASRSHGPEAWHGPDRRRDSRGASGPSWPGLDSTFRKHYFELHLMLC